MPQSSLVIWMNGVRVGIWTQTRGAHFLQYDPAWVNSPAGRALSLSLPFTPANVPHRGAVAPRGDKSRVRLPDARGDCERRAKPVVDRSPPGGKHEGRLRLPLRERGQRRSADGLDPRRPRPEGREREEDDEKEETEPRVDDARLQRRPEGRTK